MQSINTMHTYSQFRLTDSAINYIWQQLAQRAGVASNGPCETGFEVLGVPVCYGHPQEIQLDRPGIVVARCDADAWSTLIQRPPNSLHWLPIHQAIPDNAKIAVDDPVPVVFWGKGYDDAGKPFAEQRADGTIMFYADIIAATFFMLSRWEETVVARRDVHGRFPASASVAYNQGFLDRPIVDEYALILQAWLKLILTSWEPRGCQFLVKLSHDIDYVYRFPNWIAALRIFARDLVKRRDPGAAWRTSAEAAMEAIAPRSGAYFRGILTLARMSKTYGLSNDAFYFMAVNPASQDSNYNPASPLVSECIQELREEGFEIGLHAGYDTLNNLQRLAEEKARLDAVLGSAQYGGRQHYLRFQVPQTWRHWDQVGLVYDSTMGYADHEGFRCGTCHAFRPFDLEEDRELDVWEQPLIVMDQTLKAYRRLSPEQGEAQILELAQRCKRVGGTFTLLWHNTSLSREWHRWRDIYQRVVAKLAQMQSAASM